MYVYFISIFSKATPGQRMDLFQNGNLIDERLMDTRTLNRRRGSIGAIQFPADRPTGAYG